MQDVIHRIWTPHLETHLKRTSFDKGPGSPLKESTRHGSQGSIPSFPTKSKQSLLLASHGVLFRFTQSRTDSQRWSIRAQPTNIQPRTSDVRAQMGPRASPWMSCPFARSPFWMDYGKQEDSPPPKGGPSVWSCTFFAA